MINKIFKLGNNKEYVVIREKKIENKLYVLLCECDTEKDEITEELILKQVVGKDNNIYFSGEVIDIDGVCGGFNLSFAFMSAMQIAGDLK